VPVKFGHKGTDPNRNDARLTFQTRRAVQSALAGLIVAFLLQLVLNWHTCCTNFQYWTYDAIGVATDRCSASSDDGTMYSLYMRR